MTVTHFQFFVMVALASSAGYTLARALERLGRAAGIALGQWLRSRRALKENTND